MAALGFGKTGNRLRSVLESEHLAKEKLPANSLNSTLLLAPGSFLYMQFAGLTGCLAQRAPWQHSQHAASLTEAWPARCSHDVDPNDMTGWCL